jgi:hypothetical protein
VNEPNESDGAVGADVSTLAVAVSTQLDRFPTLSAIEKR